LSEIEASGGEVVEMADSTDAALAIIASADLDAAILDLKLRGRRTFVVADALAARAASKRIPRMTMNVTMAAPPADSV
jgi:CheY-like chemotaxis protein